MSQQDFNKDLVRRWFAAFPDLNDAVFEAFVHPDIVNHPAPPPLRNGLGNFKRVLLSVLAGVPDQTYRCEELVAEGALVAARTRWMGTFTGAFLGAQGNGARFDVGQSHSFRIADGKLAEHWAVRDDLEVFRQTGVTPPGAHAIDA
jgi:predicted ester cyclase